MTDYENSGVSLNRAAEAKARIAAAARKTFGWQVLTDVGHFGGFYALGNAPDSDVLVASADGVGTKLLLGAHLGILTNLGRDLIHHCINDILMCGARPLFFLDYMAFGRLEPDVAGTLAESLAGACQEYGVALIGGETAEMPDLYSPDDFDLAGTIVGTVKRNRILDGSRVQTGDVLIGVASNGLHTNGYSLVRKIFAKDISEQRLTEIKLPNGRKLAEALMEPHRCHLPTIGQLLNDDGLHALSHITGGGLENNTIRVIPKGLSLEIDWKSWPRPELFTFIQDRGSVAEPEMRHVFNLGIGAVVIADSKSVERFEERLQTSGETTFRIGRVIG